MDSFEKRDSRLRRRGIDPPREVITKALEKILPLNRSKSVQLCNNPGGSESIVEWQHPLVNLHTNLSQQNTCESEC